jgi:hypothetical protein
VTARLAVGKPISRPRPAPLITAPRITRRRRGNATTRPATETTKIPASTAQAASSPATPATPNTASGPTAAPTSPAVLVSPMMPPAIAAG